MSQAEIRKLIPALRIAIQPRYRNLKNEKGPEGRLENIGKTLTALFKEERIELNYPRADETRGYAERLIAEAIKYGDCHKQTMEIADFYIKEKQVIHKLFKVLVPRYKDSSESYTNLFIAPSHYETGDKPKAVLELKGNPYPPLKPARIPTHNWIHNILLEEAKKEYNQKMNALKHEKNRDVASCNNYCVD